MDYADLPRKSNAICIYMQMYMHVYIVRNKESGEGESAILTLNINIGRAEFHVSLYVRGTYSTLLSIGIYFKLRESYC